MDIKKQRETLETLYRQAFEPDDYVNTYYHNLDTEVEFFLFNLHQFFNSRVLAADDEGGSRRVLEVGSGPVPISMISASRWSEWIVCSDFLEINRQRITQWLRQTSGRDEDPVWLPFSSFVAQLERTTSCSAGDGKQLLDRVRGSVRAVVPCNVFLEDPLTGYKDIEFGNGSGSFDVIITTLCFEFASLTLEEYATAIRNVARLLRPSGYLIIQGALGNSHYWHNNRRFPSVSLERTTVEKAVSLAGCMLVDWKEMKRCCPPEEKPADHSAVFYCLASKI